MSPESRKHTISEALKHLVKRGSQIRPLILVFEDLHWIDRSSEEVLKSLRDDISGERVLLIFTYRPEFANSWGRKIYHSQINLNRLSNRQSLAMAANILITDNIASDLLEIILEKTEGVPFFIEEFVRSLKDLNIIGQKNGKYQLEKDVRTVEIPSSIQEVIMARVDSLPAGAKEVLQVSSVIEREFSYQLIKNAIRLSENKLVAHLSTLRDSGLLYERGQYPETSYIFNHALTRDVVYDSILSKKRQALHAGIAHSIENICKENIAEYFAELSEHFIAGGESMSLT